VHVLQLTRGPVLQSPSELADDISGNSLGALLALHFPRLRMIWSRSLHATVDIFRALKAHQDEPDPVAAAAVGASVILVDGSATSGQRPVPKRHNSSCRRDLNSYVPPSQCPLQACQWALMA
jgi:hypothetical protein